MEAVVVLLNENKSKVCMLMRYEINLYKLPSTEVSHKHDPAIGAKVVRQHIIGNARSDTIFLKHESYAYNSIMDSANEKHIYVVKLKEDASLRGGFRWIELSELHNILIYLDNPNDYGYIMDALTLVNRIDEMLSRM